MNLCYYQGKFDADHHQAPVVQNVNSAIHRIAPLVSLILIRWIAIYPMGRASHRLNNRGPRALMMIKACAVFIKPPWGTDKQYWRIFYVTVVDFDECQSLDACGDNHVCNNTVGSYRCECPIGFVADSGAQDPRHPVCVGKMLIHVFTSLVLVTIFGRRIFVITRRNLMLNTIRRQLFKRWIAISTG